MEPVKVTNLVMSCGCTEWARTEERAYYGINQHSNLFSYLQTGRIGGGVVPDPRTVATVVGVPGSVEDGVARVHPPLPHGTTRIVLLLSWNWGLECLDVVKCPFGGTVLPPDSSTLILFNTRPCKVTFVCTNCTIFSDLATLWLH